MGKLIFYTVYKIKNLVNGKIYVGVHSTSDLNDGYMGSGKLIKLAIKKYGIENFVKEILHIFDNIEDMLMMESVIVNESFVQQPNTYNLIPGGANPIEWVNSTGKNLYGMNGDFTHGGQNLLNGRQQKQRMIERGEWDAHLLKVQQAAKLKFTKGFVSNFRINNPMFTESGRLAHKEALKAINHQQGEKNSQFGTQWNHNPETFENRKIRKHDPIPVNWCKGRKLQKK